MPNTAHTTPSYDTKGLPFVEAEMKYVVDNGVKPVTYIAPTANPIAATRPPIFARSRFMTAARSPTG